MKPKPSSREAILLAMCTRARNSFITMSISAT